MDFADVERVLHICVVEIDDSDAYRTEKRQRRQRAQRNLDALLADQRADNRGGLPAGADFSAGPSRATSRPLNSPSISPAGPIAIAADTPRPGCWSHAMSTASSIPSTSRSATAPCGPRSPDLGHRRSRRSKGHL